MLGFSHTKIPYKKLLCILTHKNHIQKLPYKNLLCILTHKNCHTKNVSVFPIQKFSSIFSHTKITMYSHTQNHIQKMLVFSHKNYCVVHAQKITIQKLLAFFPIQKLYVAHTKITIHFSHTKNVM